MPKFACLSEPLAIYIKNYNKRFFNAKEHKVTDEEAKKLANYLLNSFAYNLIKNNFTKEVFEVDAGTLNYTLNQMRLNSLVREDLEA